jgi:hypothetical protein
MTPVTSFAHLVNAVYALPLAEQRELQFLLERNLIDARRDELLDNYRLARLELQSGDLKFSSDINKLKQLL